MARKRDEFNVPKVPVVPGLPSVPGRSRLRDKFSSFAPDIKIPAPEPVPDFERRLAAWQARFPSGSIPEFVVYDYLTRRKGWRLGIEFEYQLPIVGGRTVYGGFVIDFFIRLGFMAWNVQGLRYHLEKARDRAKTQVQAALLSGRGYKVVQLWEDDLLDRPEFTIEAAIKGQETNRHKDDVGIFI